MSDTTTLRAQLDYCARYCAQVVGDGIRPGPEWFAETGDMLREAIAALTPAAPDPAVFSAQMDEANARRAADRPAAAPAPQSKAARELHAAAAYTARLNEPAAAPAPEGLPEVEKADEPAAAFFLQAICAAVAGEPTSDFERSFAPVQQAADLYAEVAALRARPALSDESGR